MSDFANRLRNAEDYGNGHLEKLHIAAAEEIERLTAAYENQERVNVYLNSVLSEADQREKDARRVAIEEAIAAISDVPQFVKNDHEVMAAHGYAVRKTNRGDLIAAIRALQSEER